VEAKLWRNHEARQEVIAQVIKYASDMATWSYQDRFVGYLKRPKQ